jgi:CRISPR-associated endonuclease/helicase Cas3
MRTKTGQKVTKEMIDALATEAEQGYDPTKLHFRKIGRPSLSKNGVTPRVQYRVPHTTYTQALKRARSQGVDTISTLSRVLLKAYADGKIKLPEIVKQATRPRTHK